MKGPCHDGRSSGLKALQLALRGGIPLERETLLFTFASALDVVMTWLLLTHQTARGSTWFVESNPIARYFLYSWGFDGLVYFKFALVAFVALICQVIALRKLEVARRLLNFATLVVTGVVVYSILLLMQHR